MSSYYTLKDAKGHWYVKVKWKDYAGNNKQTTLRGFTREKDAKEAGRIFLERNTGSPNMLFGSLVENYLQEKKAKLKEVSWYDKKSRLNTWAVPYLKDKPINEITNDDIRQWQNELLQAKNKKDKPLSPGYIQNIVAEVSGCFNFAVKFYNLPKNPIKEVGNPGKKQKSINFWTPDEFNKFIATLSTDDIYYAGFMTLYYTGLRKGELLALTPADIDLDNGLISVNKTYKVLNGKPLITTPKTQKSNRTINIPSFLCDVIRKHEAAFYGLRDTDRVFPYSDTRLAYTLDKHIKDTGIKRIHIHDLRHSHASLLIEMGFSALLIQERLGHEDVNVTLGIYGHLFPSKQSEVAEKLDNLYSTKWSVK